MCLSVTAFYRCVLDAGLIDIWAQWWHDVVGGDRSCDINPARYSASWLTVIYDSTVKVTLHSFY